jgi:hypothetical protein
MTVGGQTTYFFYDAHGQRVRTLYPNGTNVYTPFPEYDETVPASGTATQRSNYFLNGQLVAVRTVTGSTIAHYFTFADHPSTGSGQAWAISVPSATAGARSTQTATPNTSPLALTTLSRQPTPA